MAGKIAAKKIGFIGLGNLGGGIAGVLVEDGHEVYGLDKDPARVAALEAKGMIPKKTPKDVAEGRDIVFTCLPQSDIVEQVCLGKDGIIESGNSGMLLIDCTSGYPAKTLAIAAALKEKGIRMIDAPVTGGEGGGGSIAAPNRALTMIVGGDKPDVDEAWPILEGLSKHLYFVGELSHGHVVKAINNMIAMASRIATMEGMAVAAKHGIDLVTVANVLVNGTGSTATAQRVAAAGTASTKTNRPGGFSVGLMTKDLRHMSMICRDVGVPSFVTDHAFHVGEIMTRQLGYDADILSSNQVLADWSGVEFK